MRTLAEVERAYEDDVIRRLGLTADAPVVPRPLRSRRGRCNTCGRPVSKPHTQGCANASTKAARNMAP